QYVYRWMPANKTMGWKRQTEIVSGYVTYDLLNLPSCGLLVYSNWIYHDPSGTEHFLYGNVQSGHCPPYNYPRVANVAATDGSGYQATISADPSATIYPSSCG